MTSSLQYRTTLFTSALIMALLWMMLATGANAASDGRAISARNTVPTAEHAGTAIAAPTPTPTPSCPPPDGSLKFVVALFRHGVRAPLETFGKNAGVHSKDPWPNLKNDWGVCDSCWGYLTPHGATAVKVLGAYYGKYYKNAWPSGFKAYLWADMNERTRATAEALAAGMRGPGIDVKVGTYLVDLTDTKPDPLFHPFPAMCGTPDVKELQRIATYIKAKCPDWLHSFEDQLSKLDEVLACENKCGDKPCEPLSCVSCLESPTPTPTPSARPSSPIKWDGRFSYASSATEAFLLEYANGMPTDNVGWGNLIDKQTGSTDKLCKLLRLHEFYFEETERESYVDKDKRDKYLAGIQGANLVREIHDQLNKAANKPVMGKCPRPSTDSKFVALVGHDTNLANVQSLLKIKWSFGNDPQLPPDISSLPDNDALPAGALLFELREGSPDYRVRIHYVTQSLNEMRNPREQDQPYCVHTTCGDENRPCEISLGDFNKLAGDVITKYGSFLSKCQNGEQTCP